MRSKQTPKHQITFFEPAKIFLAIFLVVFFSLRQFSSQKRKELSKRVRSIFPHFIFLLPMQTPAHLNACVARFGTQTHGRTIAWNIIVIPIAKMTQAMVAGLNRPASTTILTASNLV